MIEFRYIVGMYTCTYGALCISVMVLQAPVAIGMYLNGTLTIVTILLSMVCLPTYAAGEAGQEAQEGEGDSGHCQLWGGGE